jgi:hypothetical protein
MTRFYAVVLVLLCGVGAAVIWRCGARRRRRHREQHEAETLRTLEDRSRLRGM